MAAGSSTPNSPCTGCAATPSPYRRSRAPASLPDRETGLLRNRIGARTKIALDEAEGDLSFARLMQLMDHPPKATRDLDELRAIHRQLFQDVYKWAGQLRMVDVRKNVEGAEYFLPVSMIGRAASYATDELRGDNDLRGMDRDRFIDRLAYHYDQFNPGGRHLSG